MIKLNCYFCLQLLLFVGLCTANADDSRTLQPGFERVLKWLPADTETLVAAQSIELTMPPPKGAIDWGSFDLKPLIDSLALGGLAELENAKYMKPLLGRKITLALCGGRNFEIVSAFGSLRSESCSIIVFANDFGEAGREWIDIVRRGATDIRDIGGHKVFVFPATTVMEGSVKPKPWQGTYLVMLKPDTLLCASSDHYLAEVLRRADTSPEGGALAANLPEWKSVDPRAQAWMLRHIPAANDGGLITGLTWTWAKNRLQLIYLPKAQAAEKAHTAITARWTPPKLPDLPGRPDGDSVLDAMSDTIELRPDGTVAVSIRTNDLGVHRAFRLGMHLIVLRGEDGLLGAR